VIRRSSSAINSDAVRGDSSAGEGSAEERLSGEVEERLLRGFGISRYVNSNELERTNTNSYLYQYVKCTNTNVAAAGKVCNAKPIAINNLQAHVGLAATNQERKPMPTIETASAVTAISPAPPGDAAAHFAGLLAFEADCWDVHDATVNNKKDFVLLDVRSPEAYAAGHVPGAVNLPHGRIVERNLAQFDSDTIFVTYCNGPHCNGADRGALRLAELGRPVKKMIGGVTGWLDEGFSLVTDEGGQP
jgi:rhodanese-related sulfurtransferase